MTITELRINWARWVDIHDINLDSINDFCNTYATSYEEYMSLWELLTDNLEEDP